MLPERIVPPLGDYPTEEYWLRAVSAVMTSLGYPVDTCLSELWTFACDAVRQMGDIFWDVDDHDPCGYCHHEGNCSNSVQGMGQPYPSDPAWCDSWYGESASDRLFTWCAANVLDSVLRAYIVGRDGRCVAERADR